VLNRKEFKEKPPILIDIGASSEFYSHWSVISPFSICLAFDPDNRDMEHSKDGKHPYFKHIMVSAIASSQKASTSPLFLTKEPGCSSTLKPYSEKLSEWEFSDKFEIEKTLVAKAVNLNDTLKKHEIHYIDWFKTDSQGVDLRLFEALNRNISLKILAADFEPGIIDAYEGEDKAWKLLQHLETTNLWIDSCKIMGTKRLPSKLKNELTKTSVNYLTQATKESPGWAEISCLNDMKDKNLSKREYLLMWVIAELKKQRGFAYSVADTGYKIFRDSVFKEMSDFTLKQSENEYLYLKKLMQLSRIENYLKSIVKKVLSSLKKI
jgi:hypothetical protein